MRNYKVYFELGGKKMVKTILAANKEVAGDKLRASIIIHKIDLDKEPFNDSMYILDKINDLFK